MSCVPLGLFVMIRMAIVVGQHSGLRERTTELQFRIEKFDKRPLRFGA